MSSCVSVAICDSDKWRRVPSNATSTRIALATALTKSDDDADASDAADNTRSDIEADALRKRQRDAVVDGARRPPHVAAPRIRARFAAAARFFLAAEGAADFGAAGPDVDVGDAAIA